MPQCLKHFEHHHRAYQGPMFHVLSEKCYIKLHASYVFNHLSVNHQPLHPSIKQHTHQILWI